MLSVVVPAYNERERIPVLMGELEAFMQDHPDIVDEVVVVDDGSSDQTVERVMYWMDRLPLNVLRHAQNSGKWAAVRSGLRAARNDACLILDADGSASIWELEKMGVDDVRERIEDKVPVFGSRFMDGAVVEDKTALRTMVSHGYRTYVRFCYWFATGKTDVDDMQAPFKLVYVSRIQGELRTKQFSGDIELACRIPDEIENHPLHFVHKRGGAVSAGTIFQMAIETARIAIGMRFGTWMNNDNNVY